MTDRVKVAVLSFAHGHAIGYLRYLAGLPGVAVAASDPDAQSGETNRGLSVASQLGVPYFDSYADALAWAPDAVVVCSENTRHRELVELAAAAGASILCEKPLATTVSDAVAMVDAANAANVTLMVAYPVRFAPSFAALRERVHRGDLGDILSIVGTNNGKIPLDRDWFTDPALSGGGSIVDHVVHCADLIDALIPERAVSVRAVSNRILHADRAGTVETDAVETGGIASMIYENGIIAAIDFSWSQPESAASWGGLTLEVTGTQGSMRIAPFASHIGGYGSAGANWVPYGADLDSALIDEFLSSVREGRQAQPDGGVGLRTTTIMAAALEAASTGGVIRL
jgi:1,5-anhydro-D-fructose reductase (1,5-anhydro-D-mannitol-forming)